MSEAILKAVAEIALVAIVWIPAVLLLMKQLATLARLAGSSSREMDRERRDNYAMIQRLVEKATCDKNRIAGVHAEERAHQATLDHNLQEKDIAGMNPPPVDNGPQSTLDPVLAQE